MMLENAKAHMIAEYPREACGVIVDDIFWPVENIAENPYEEFQMPADAWIKYGKVSAVLHSHIVDRHPHEPSAADINRQQETGVPWGIIHVAKDSASDPLWFGDHLLDTPLIGRQFVLNVTDCWQLVRSYYWQTRGLKLPSPGVDPQGYLQGNDALREHVAAVGFYPVPEHVAEVGDMCFMRIRREYPNHCAVMYEHGILLHHLPNRLSCREAAHRWQSHVTGWYRALTAGLVRQERLGSEFEAVLHANLWDLYAR